MSKSIISSFQEWFSAQCDGEWEHEYGIKIETLDNPGWAVKIDLIGTKLENINFTEIRIEKSESDWIYCSVENNVFKGFGGPSNFEEILSNFIMFVHMSNE
jgi:hypothetical protein